MQRVKRALYKYTYALKIYNASVLGFELIIL